VRLPGARRSRTNAPPLRRDVARCTARPELHWLIERDPHALDRRRQVLDAADRAFVVAHRQVARVGLFFDLGFDRHVRLQRGTAGQAQAFVALVVHQREAAGFAVIDLAVADLRLAGRAQAVAAGVRQVDAGAQRGVEDGLAVFDLSGPAVRW
jgi:hypothetical protein